MHDLIVVGAGPAGSQVAKEFADRGLDVTVIEQSEEIGRPLACSGHVSPDIWDFVPEENRERLEQNSITGARFHADKDSTYSFYRDETVSYVIDRVELDRVKAEQAMESGASYRLGETVMDVTERERYVKVDTDKSSYRAKMVAGCDGAFSTVRSQTGIEEPDHYYQGILCFSEEDDSGDFVDVYLEVPSFFGWRIPRGDSVEYGAAVPTGEEPSKWLEKITDRNEIDCTDHCAGAIPVGPPDRVTTDRVFLVGDSAGQTKPFTGGGIIYGMRAAEKAGETIDVFDPDSLEIYEKAWRDELGADIWLGKLIEKGYSLPRPLQKAGMWIFRGEVGVHMDRPTTLFSPEQLKSLWKRQ